MIIDNINIPTTIGAYIDYYIGSNYQDNLPNFLFIIYPENIPTSKKEISEWLKNKHQDNIYKKFKLYNKQHILIIY